MNQQLYNIALLVLAIWFVGNQTAQTINLIKLYKEMANLTDLQTATADLTTAATAIEGAVASLNNAAATLTA